VFKGLRLHIGPGGGFQERCLARKLDNGASGQVNIGYFNQCKAANDYYSFHTCFENG
jgi:tyrosinase